MKTIGRLLTVSLALCTLAACSSTETRVKKEFEDIRRGPANAPYKSITNFSHALQCMDKLMLDKKINKVPILIEAIDDKTKTVNAGTRDMLISAISEMTIRSHGIKVIAYGKGATNLISFMKLAKQKGLYKNTPLFDIHGSITQHDESVVSSGRSLGLSVFSEGDLGIAGSTSVNVIALDLNVLNTRDLSVVPGVSSHNSIAIFKRGKSFDADARINKFGVYFDISLRKSEGKTQALRNLVELGAIETIGKLVKVPYWRCLGAKDSKVANTATGHLFAQSAKEEASIKQAEANMNLKIAELKKALDLAITN